MIFLVNELFRLIFLQKYNKNFKLIAFKVVFWLFGGFWVGELRRFYIRYRLFSNFLCLFKKNVLPL